METPQHSDLGNIGNGTFLVYAPFRPPSSPKNLHEEWIGCVPPPDTSTLASHIFIKLAWDPNQELDLHYYKVFQDSSFLDWTTSPYYVVSLPNPLDKTYSFYVTAVDVFGFESEHSNILIYSPTSGGGQNIKTSELQEISLNINPNTISSLALIEFRVSHKQNVNIEVYNLIGKKIETIYKGSANKLMQRIRWEPDNRYSKGVYFVTLISENGITTKKVIINR